MNESVSDSGNDPSATDAHAGASFAPTPAHGALGDPIANVSSDDVDASAGSAATSSGDGVDGVDGVDDAVDDDGAAGSAAAKKRRRGSRGGKRRKRPAGAQGDEDDEDDESELEPDSNSDFDDAARHGDSESADSADGAPAAVPPQRRTKRRPADAEVTVADMAEAPGVQFEGELPERMSEGRPSSTAAAAAALVPKVPPPRPRIGDTRPAPAAGGASPDSKPDASNGGAAPAKGRQRGRQQNAAASAAPPSTVPVAASGGAQPSGESKSKRKRGGQKVKQQRVQGEVLDAEISERRRGRERNGRPLGRYAMAVQVRAGLTQVAVLEGKSLIEHYVSRPADDISQIHGNIYLGRVQNVLPGMEAAFVDIATPKNAVLYRGDVQYDKEDLVAGSSAKDARIEQLLRSKQMIVSQVTKNPIGAKGARLTQEVSLPGRFVVLIPNSSTYGISKRLPDDERKRLRSILDRVKPAEHGIIVRTAAETATEHELRADVLRLVETWTEISRKAEAARKAGRPALLYREPELAVRVIREEFNADYRSVTIDDRALYEEVKSYITAMNPELADRVEYHDVAADGLPLYERLHIHEQVHKALDRKVWLPSGGSLIIEHTEALTVIDVNTGRNVGSTNLETTVFHNNLEAADEIARQLRLRDIGGIIVIDFIDMEIKDNRRKVVESFRAALARDKTRTQVFDISELGLVEMTRKRIGEGLLTNFADQCPNCDGRGVVVDLKMLE